MDDATTTQIIFHKRNFFNTAIADIYRAIDGKSYTGAFILTFCLIDYLTWIEFGYTKNAFNNWISKRLKPLNVFYEEKEEELYSVRCGLVHSYGPSNQILTKKFAGYELLHCSPGMHLQRVNTDVLKICLYTLLTETVYAAHLIFEELKKKITTEQINRLDQQIKILRREPPLFFKEMHRALSCFDNPNTISLIDVKAEYTQKILYAIS